MTLRSPERDGHRVREVARRLRVLVAVPALEEPRLARLDRVGWAQRQGGQVDIDAILDIGMIPPVRKEVVETAANGAGFGAAMVLTDEGFEKGVKLAQHAEQIDLDTDANFNMLFMEGMYLVPNGTL